MPGNAAFIGLFGRGSGHTGDCLSLKLTIINSLGGFVITITSVNNDHGGRQMSNPSEINLNSPAPLSLGTVFRRTKLWWYKRAEEHYLICAAVEHARAREAEENEAYYQKRAAMARSAQLWD